MKRICELHARGRVTMFVVEGGRDPEPFFDMMVPIPLGPCAAEPPPSADRVVEEEKVRCRWRYAEVGRPELNGRIVHVYAETDADVPPRRCPACGRLP